jgi:hypothetical protein
MEFTMNEKLEEIKTMSKQELHKFVQDLYCDMNIKHDDFEVLLRAVDKREYELLGLL